MKEVAIITAYSDRHLRQQAKNSLRENTDKKLYDYYEMYGMVDGEMKTVNKLMNVAINGNHKWYVRADDDLYFNKDWLPKMLEAMKNNPDVALLGACRYPTHKILEEREDIYIMDICPGNHWLYSRETWDKYGPFYEDFIQGHAEDVRFCKKLQSEGLKVACMKDPLLVVHCGLVNTKGRGRSPYVTGYTQALADIVGAKTNV